MKRALFVALFVEVNALPVQPFMERTAMVENAVYNHLYSQGMHLFHKAGKVLVGLFQIGFIRYPAYIFGGVAVVLFPALHTVSHVVFYNREVRVDIVVVLRVVLVVGGRNEKGIEVHRLHAQIFKVLQLLLHALQIAAVKVVYVHSFGQFKPIAHLARVPARVIVLVVLNVVGRFAVAEAVAKNLIEHPALSPIGHLAAWDERKIVLVLIVVYRAEAVIIELVIVVYKLKVITYRLLTAGERY